MTESKSEPKENQILSQPTKEILEQINERESAHPSMDINAEPWVLLSRLL